MTERVDVETAIHVAAFRSALRAFLRSSEQLARSQGLTPQRHLLLLMIKGAPDGSEQATVMELADRMQLAQSTVTELVSRAEEVGLIDRERSDADGRVVHLRLTDDAERRLGRLIHAHADERHELRRMLSELDELGEIERLAPHGGGAPFRAASSRR